MKLYQSFAFSERGKLQGGYQEYLRRAAVIRSSSGLFQKLKEAVIGVKSTDVKEIEICHRKGLFSVQREHKFNYLQNENEPLDDSYLNLCPHGRPLIYVVKVEKRFKSHFSSPIIDLPHLLLWKNEAECLIGRHNGTTGLTPRLNVEITDIDLYVPLPYDRKPHGN